MFSHGSTPNKKRSGQGDESRQRKRSEAHWSLSNHFNTHNLCLNKFFPKTQNYLCPAFHARLHSTAHNRLRTKRHLDQIPLFHLLFSPSLKWPGCEKKFGVKFGENRGQDHCHRPQITKCFHSANCRNPGQQHTRRGKTNSPYQANQSHPPHPTSQGRELASRGMKTLPTQIPRRRNHGPRPPRIARLRHPIPPRVHPHPARRADAEEIFGVVALIMTPPRART